MGKTLKTIDLTPTWMGVYPLLEEWILHGNAEQKEVACSELKKLCKFADNFNSNKEG